MLTANYFKICLPFLMIQKKMYFCPVMTSTLQTSDKYHFFYHVLGFWPTHIVLQTKESPYNTKSRRNSECDFKIIVCDMVLWNVIKIFGYMKWRMLGKTTSLMIVWNVLKCWKLSWSFSLFRIFTERIIKGKRFKDKYKSF